MTASGRSRTRCHHRRAPVPLAVRSDGPAHHRGSGGVRRRRRVRASRRTGRCRRRGDRRARGAAEHDRRNGLAVSLDLPGRQLDLLQAVVESGTPVVLVLMNGRPLDLRWAAEHVPAILDIWYPGTRGGEATANLLFGDVSPGGKLPFTWPRTAGQVPMIYSHTKSHSPEDQGRRYWDEPSTPLFPFGHGSSYGAIRVRRTRHRSADDHHRRHGHRVDRGHQHRRSRSRRGRPAVPPPASRHGVSTGARTQGLPADHAGRGRVTHRRVPDRPRRASLLERRRPRLGDRRIDRSTSGSAATRRPNARRRSRSPALAARHPGARSRVDPGNDNATIGRRRSWGTSFTERSPAAGRPRRPSHGTVIRFSSENVLLLSRLGLRFSVTTGGREPLHTRRRTTFGWAGSCAGWGDVSYTEWPQMAIPTSEEGERVRKLTITLIATALALAACSTSSDNSSDATTPPATEGTVRHHTG